MRASDFTKVSQEDKRALWNFYQSFFQLEEEFFQNVGCVIDNMDSRSETARNCLTEALDVYPATETAAEKLNGELSVVAERESWLQDPLDYGKFPVHMTDLSVNDGAGGEIIRSVTDTEVMIVPTFAMESSVKENPHMIIIAIHNSKGHTVMLEWLDRSDIEGLDPDESVGFTWMPIAPDTYSIRMFVWSDLRVPVPLMAETKSLDISVLEASDDENILSCKGTASCYTAVVTNIIDGDTIDVKDQEDTVTRIRLALTNTPERGESLYREALQFTGTLCPIGSTVIIDEDDGQLEGSFGRMIAKVTCDDKTLNAELLYRELAVIDTSFCQISEFGSENWAKRYGC